MGGNPESARGSSSGAYDNARVWVNKDYGVYDKNKLKETPENLTYREYAMKQILQIIDDHNIKIFLMDYKLGAGYLSKTGIDLATAINEIRKDQDTPPLPVVFISKDQKNEKIEKELKQYQWINGWVYKGFFGDEILEARYIENYVINGEEGIEALLKNVERVEVTKGID